MLMALLRGKLSRDQENMEDILTSNVFGTFKYLPPQDALLPFLSNAALPNGEMPLASLPGHAEVRYKFWPWLEEPDCEGCEPDVLISLELPGGSEEKLILVEAKYLSGKSSEEGEGNAPTISLLASGITSVRWRQGNLPPPCSSTSRQT